ncbi:MAG: sensor histidine kinase [Eubacterium sp.]|nr:sensor histidine kinase [Eubacterium sp.]
MQELSMNVLDVAENSMRAQAKNVTIKVIEDSAADKLSILIEDDGCGMSEEQVAQVTDPFFTTRTTRKVGLGVPLFKMAAEMSGGDFSITSKPGVGTKTCATFGLTNIDRMPLGDMASTMQLLICSHEDVNVMYTHIVDGREFFVSTDQLKEVLDGVSLETPEIRIFVGEYLRENIEALYTDEEE